MANADISLLFGVLGEGSLSGESGSLIKSQLDQIVTAINKDPLKIKFKLDTTAAEQRSWAAQIRSSIAQINSKNSFSVKISKIKIDASALNDFKQQLNAVINTMHLAGGTSVTLRADGIGEITSKLKQEASAAEDAARKTAEFKVQIDALNAQKSSIKKQLDNAMKSAATDEEREKIAQLVAEYEQYAVKIEEVRAAKAAASPEERAAIEAEGAAISDKIAKHNEERRAAAEAAAAAVDAAKQKERAEREAADSERESAKEAERNARANAELNSVYKQVEFEITRIQKAQKDWTAAETGRSRDAYASLSTYVDKLKELQSNLKGLTASQIKEQLTSIQNGFAQSARHIKECGENTKTFSERIGGLAEKFGTWFSITRVIMAAVRAIRQMVKSSIELDSAMTQMQVVTKASAEQMNAFAQSASDAAKRIGSSISDFVSSATTFARLGYSMDESSTLAEFTAMLQNVGNIDVVDAQNAVTAIIKAFRVNVDDIKSVMDDLIVTGNNFPISVSQIAEGMNNASSALAAAGNTFEQSVALLTAANTTIQDAAKSSTGLRTIAARIRNTKAELDELGEAMSDAKYGELIEALTNAGVKLTDMNDEFRSTYDIIADLANVWDTLDSMSKSGIVSALAGNRQQAVFYSLVEQFQEASGAMEAMKNSAGSLDEAYATFMQSIQAHINQFKAAFQELSSSTMTRDFVNNIVDLGTQLLGILERVSKIINAVGGLNTVLYTTAGIIATINADAIIRRLESIPTKLIAPIKSLITSFNAAKAAGLTTGQSISYAFTQAASGITAAKVAVGAFVVVLGAALLITNKITEAEEKRRRELEATYNTAIASAKESESLYDAYAKYLENTSAIDDNTDSKNALEESTRSLAEALGLEGDAAKKTADELKGLTEAELEAAYYNSLNAVDTAEKKLVGNIDSIKGSTAKSFVEFWGAALGYDVTSGSQADRANNLIAVYDELIRQRNDALAAGETETLGFKNLQSAIELIEDDVNDLIIARDVLTKTTSRYNDVLNGTVRLEEDDASTSDRSASNINKQASALSVLADTIADVKSRFDLANTASEEMKLGGGLSVDTIKSLASAEENYLDYLYEENGLVKLNTDAWIANAKVKLQSNAGLIEDEDKLKVYLAIYQSIFNTANKSADALTGLSALSTALNSLANAYDGLTDGNAQEFVNALASIKEEFADSVPNIDAYIDRLQSSGKDAEKVGTILGELAYEKALNIAKSNDLSKADEAVITALLQEAGVASTDATTLQQLSQVMQIVSNTSLDLSSQVDALWSLASAALGASGALSSVFSTTLADGTINPDFIESGMSVDEWRKANILSMFKTSWSKSLKIDTTGLGGGGGGGSGTKKVEKYIADIDEYYKALKRIESVQLKLSKLNSDLDFADTDEQKIALTKELIAVYADEKDALENLNTLRTGTIESHIAELEKLGFIVKYNAETNEFYIDNLEHLNELQAQSKGEYDSLTEATNALIQDTEELIDTMDELNQANQEGVESMRQLDADTRAAKNAIIDYLNEIVSKSNELVDSFQNVYDTLHGAADEYAENGYITVDMLQSLLGLGAQYMQYLTDENGMLVINHDAIDKVIKLKMKELALNEALTYVERLRLAMQDDSVEDLNNLLYATTEASDATWNLVYANLALLGLDEKQYKAALHNIQTIRALANNAMNGVGQIAGETTEKLNDMKSGLDDILKYTMDMLKQQLSDQIDALEKMKTAFGDIISLRKEALSAAKKESDYQKNVAKQAQEIAKIQAKINALSLDDSREAKAKRAKLEEELAELQGNLADEQADHAREAQEDALDDIQQAYEDEKNAEIETLQKTLSSQQKLYDAAIEYISTHWETLYDELILWNTEYGSVLNSEITSAWNNCLAAAKEYGDYLTALSKIQADIDQSHHDIIGENTVYTPEDIIAGETETAAEEIKADIAAQIAKMLANSKAWWGSIGNPEMQGRYASANESIVDYLNKTYGLGITSDNGVWRDSKGNALYTYTPTSAQREQWDAWVHRNDKPVEVNQGCPYSEPYVDGQANWISYWSNNQGEGVKWLQWHLNQDGANLEENGVFDWGVYNALVAFQSKNGLQADGILGTKTQEALKRLVPHYHSGGIVGDGTLEQNEVMAVLKKGEAVLDEKREKGLYRILDFVQLLTDKMGSIIGTGSFGARAFSSDIAARPIHDLIAASGANGAFTFNPVVNVNISHNGSLTESDAKRYGKIAADSALQELNDAFSKRGITTLGGATLK